MPLAGVGLARGVDAVVKGGGFSPLDLLGGSSVTDAIPKRIGGDAGPALSGGNPLAQGTLAAPFVVGEGATAGGGTPNLTTLALIGAAAAVAIAIVRRF